MYTKRQTIPKNWPIPRKGTKYVVRASHDKKHGLPLLIIFREMLKITKNRKEVKKILRDEEVSVNNKIVRRENFSVAPFDIIKIMEKSYELGFSDKGKFILKETGKKENISKVVGKKLIKNKKVQLNLLYGKNIFVGDREKIKIGDSVFISNGKIVRVLPLENKREAIVFAGKYKGKEGVIEKIESGMATLFCKDKKITVPVKSIIIVK